MCKVHPGEGLRDKVLQKAFGRFRAQREERGVCDPKSCVLSFARHGSYSTLTLQCIADVFVHGRLGGGGGGLHLFYIQFKISFDLLGPTLRFRCSINFTGWGKIAFHFPESVSIARH